MHAPLRLLACSAAVSIAACGGSSGTDDPFGALAAGRARVAAVAPPTSVPVSQYDFASGRLTLFSLALAGSSACYDVLLLTVSTAPIRVELNSAIGSPCQVGAAVARYDGASQILSAPKLTVADTGLCYDVLMRTVQAAPMRLELTSATPTACTPTPG